jgi:hypothetical protein
MALKPASSRSIAVADFHSLRAGLGISAAHAR